MPDIFQTARARANFSLIFISLHPTEITKVHHSFRATEDGIPHRQTCIRHILRYEWVCNYGKRKERHSTASDRVRITMVKMQGNTLAGLGTK